MTSRHTPDSRAPLPTRLWQYQKERFPLLAYAPMVLVFTASAAAYSRAARGEVGFIPWPLYAVGAFTALIFFAGLRILDEHKDAEVDRLYRPELPVPRGLVTHAELRRVGIAMLAAAIVLNLLVAPPLLAAVALVGAWATLMTVEFFVPEWLRARPVAYLLSHMAIMPLIDFYTTGLDWLAGAHTPPAALAWFLILTFGNGIVVEVGRKIRPVEAERDGVDSYTRAWGLRAAPLTWIAILVATASVAAIALAAIDAGPTLTGLLALFVILCAIPAVGFVRSPTAGRARAIETASGLWTIAMYLLLGATPLLAAFG